MLEIMIVQPEEILQNIKESIADFEKSLGNTMTSRIKMQCSLLQKTVRAIETELR